MQHVYAPANIERSGVVAGFTLSPGAGLVPAIARGVLFAQGAMYRPDVAPALPAAPAGARSWLFYNSSGFYWRATAVPNAADDAFIGWVRTSATAVVMTSSQRIEVPDAQATTSTTVIDIGPTLPAEG
jgi:hypothetical protein